VTRRALVLGAGGSVGHVYMLCTLARLERETGWDPRRAAVLIGTSAGSVIATRLAAGKSVADQLAATSADDGKLPPRPRLRPASLPLLARGLRGEVSLLTGLTGLLPEGTGAPLRLADHVPGQLAHPACWVVAMDADSGARVAFGHRDAPPASIADAVAASCAIPGWVAPVPIGGRRYLDGGAVSPTSADLLLGEPVDEVVIVSPMTSPRFVRPASLGQAAERVLRHALSRVLDREVAILERAKIRVVRIEPTAHELRLMGANFMDGRRAASLRGEWS
jgi:NTE family protein